MPCYHPLKGFRSAHVGPTGKRQIVFNRKEGFVDLPVTVPCGQCVGCRLERSRQWALRCIHEAKQYENNCFITLTYNDNNLPNNNSLIKRHYQLFIKRLRKHYTGKLIRYYHCGEYGETTQRPHYHAILFNHDFKDKQYHKSINENKLYTSQTLETLWSHGFCTVGDVTFESAAYVARYIMKKVTGDLAEEHYNGRLPEYTTMSRRPGIGKTYYDKFRTDVYPDDFVVARGIKMKPPKYYDRQFEIECPKDYGRLRAARVRKSKIHADNNTPARLKVREKVQIARLKLLPRKVE